MINMINKLKKYIYNKKNRGFTLIETLVAVAVLLISIVAPLQIASTALFSAFYSRDEITAYYLAAEAIEYIRNVRDTTGLNDLANNQHPGVFWLTNVSECIPDTNNDKNGCIINTRLSFSNASIASCPISGCPRLLFDSNSGIWNYDTPSVTNTTSRFTRTVQLLQQNDNGIPGEVVIKVTVEWQGVGTFGGEKKVTLYGYMADWHNR